VCTGKREVSTINLC